MPPRNEKLLFETKTKLSRRRLFLEVMDNLNNISLRDPYEEEGFDILGDILR